MAEMEMRQWYAIYSKPRKEEFTEFHLRKKGLEVFFPRLLVPEFLQKRQRIVPLFPNYLFVRIQISKECHYVLWSPGVKRLIGFNGNPTPLDEGVMDFLMQQADSDGVIAARSNLRTDQEVQITGGPFDGLVGVIQEPPSGKGRVKVLLRLLSRQVNVEVPVRFVKSGWVA